MILHFGDVPDYPKIVCQDQRPWGFDHKTLQYYVRLCYITGVSHNVCGNELPGRGLSSPSTFLVINELVIFQHIENSPNNETCSAFGPGDPDKGSISATFCVIDFNVVSCISIFWIGVAEISRQSSKSQQLHQSAIVCSHVCHLAALKAKQKQACSHGCYYLQPITNMTLQFYYDDIIISIVFGQN